MRNVKCGGTGFDAKECLTEKFILQKLIYIHENPVRGKWKLCKSSLDDLHSSAPFYFNGRQQLFEVKDYREFIDGDSVYSRATSPSWFSLDWSSFGSEETRRKKE